MKYDLFVRERTVVNPEPSRSLVQNGVAVDGLKCHFDDEWADYDSVYAVFTNEADDASETVEVDGGEIGVPASVLQSVGRVFVSLVGYVGDERRAVTRLMESPFAVDESGMLPGDAVGEAAADLLAQIQAKIDGLVEEYRAAVASAQGAAEAARDAQVTSARAETLEAGSEATAEVEGTTLVLGIPRGEDGLSVTVGSGAPTGEAPAGSGYIDGSTGDLYVYE